MTDTEIVDAINHKLSLLTVTLATVGDNRSHALNALSLFAVKCNQLIAQRDQP